jgi:2-iminobutanoate/2-iminopropanoate deaminase
MAEPSNVISPRNLPPPGGAYSPGRRVGGIVATAGQVGIDPATGLLLDGVEAQTRQALSNLETVLVEAGAGWGDVIKTTCFLADIADFAAFNRAYESVVPRPWPARSTVGVSLAGDLRVEIEALVVLPA